MSNAIITVSNLSKRYQIGHQIQDRARYTAIRDVVAREVRDFARKAINLVRGEQIIQGDQVEDFWALRDINFEVEQGEVVGVIGRNGAGKSTLLKILSRITEPTTGRIRLGGRVASLLEVGTGFHNELTGRENIFLNGAILGMTRREIRKKFDEIVAFAEVEKFLDTPVKRYSSGMYVRLAFAIAAHLEPEILLVDEVLAVGDAEFQKKCLGKMSEVAQGGRTVLFVSHNMPTINRLCRRCILLDSGQIAADGNASTVTSKYMMSDTGTMAAREWHYGSGPGDDTARLVAVRARQHGEVCAVIDIRYPVQIEVIYANNKDNAQLLTCVAFFDEQGNMAFCSADFGDHKWAKPRPQGIYQSTCEVPGNLFSEGTMRVYAEVSTRNPLYQIHFQAYDAVAFQVVDTGKDGSVRAGWGRPIPGVTRPLCKWETATVRS